MNGKKIKLDFEVVDYKNEEDLQGVQELYIELKISDPRISEKFSVQGWGEGNIAIRECGASKQEIDSLVSSLFPKEPKKEEASELVLHYGILFHKYDGFKF